MVVILLLDIGPLLGSVDLRINYKKEYMNVWLQHGERYVVMVVVLDGT